MTKTYRVLEIAEISNGYWITISYVDENRHILRRKMLAFTKSPDIDNIINRFEMEVSNDV